MYSHIWKQTQTHVPLSLYTSGRGHGKKFPMFCASCLPVGFNTNSWYFFPWQPLLWVVSFQWGLSSAIWYAPYTCATYFPFVYCYHIFLLSFRRKKVMALVVFCLAGRDARRGVVQITTGLHNRFLSLPQCCMLWVVASVIKWCIDDRWKEI